MYSAADVYEWHERYWRVVDWRGKRGEQPSLKDVQALIGRIRSLPPQDEIVPDTDPGESNPYLADPYFERERGEIAPRLESETREIDPRHAEAWLAVMGQLRVQLKTATYDTWLRRVVLLEAHDLSWHVGVSSQYVATWIERSVLHAIKTQLAAILSRHDLNHDLHRDDITVSLEIAQL